jgi:hypothetical protein
MIGKCSQMLVSMAFGAKSTKKVPLGSLKEKGKAWPISRCTKLLVNSFLIHRLKELKNSFLYADGVLQHYQGRVQKRGSWLKFPKCYATPKKKKKQQSVDFVFSLV